MRTSDPVTIPGSSSATVQHRSNKTKSIFSTTSHVRLTCTSLFWKDEDIDQTKVIVKELQPGVCLIHEESLEDTKLFYVLSGALTVSLQSQADKKDEWVQQSSLFLAHVGEMTGALAVLTGEPSLFTVKTRYASRVGILEKSTVYE
ncbi:PNPLA6 [Cordylochernes scorpioides]|uniref:PNPLA6 n=1 Tax=Cordylochernes scorpioides TaxID=51811 RepID=A0ABY6L620_9ARAC|nr:PNPLA6 [Cordylochernes scorpioides]